jgi:hypothetical protein
VTGDKPSTIGDTAFFPVSKETLNKRLRCEAFQNASLRQNLGDAVVDASGQDVLRHEAVHSMQEGGFPSFDAFLVVYGLESHRSWVATGNPWQINLFEVGAGLARGNYLPPVGGKVNCYDAQFWR